MYLDMTTMANLKGYRDVFTSCDLDETRQYIGNVIKTHELKVLNTRQSLDVKVGRTDFGEVSFMYIDHGADVYINPGMLETIFLLQVPVNATGQVRVGNSVMDISTEMAYMVSPTFDLEMRFTKNCSHIVLTVTRARLENFLEQKLQRHLDVPLEFKPKIELSDQHNQELINLIMYMTKQLKQASPCLAHPMLRSQAESLLLGTMLIGLEHNYRAELVSESTAPAPYYIKRARSFIQENAELPLTPEDVARESCISLRSVYAGFRTYLNSTPMAYIRNVKLQKIHDELERSEPSEVSVSEIALKYSISHLGSFAANYREKFGELPSITLRKKQF